MKDIGDSTYTNTEKVSVYSDSLDQMEYDCWDLFLAYAKELGVSLTNSEGEEITAENAEDSIDFSLAKEIQETILNLFEAAGIEMKYELPESKSKKYWTRED